MRRLGLAERLGHVTCRAGPDDVGHDNAPLLDCGATRF